MILLFLVGSVLESGPGWHPFPELLVDNDQDGHHVGHRALLGLQNMENCVGLGVYLESVYWIRI